MTDPKHHDEDEVRDALVTGGTSGIGRAIAVGLAESGWNVTSWGVSDCEAELFREGIPSDVEDRIEVAVVDIRDSASVTRAAQRFRRLDLLVNSAGIILRDGAEHDPKGFAEVIDVNLNGTMRVCAACKPALIAAKGSVVNIASMLSFYGSGYQPAYSASKGGVAQLTRSLAIAWAADGVRVNAIAPGWIRTPLTEPLRADPNRERKILERTPLGRWGEPEELVGPMLFLASSAAAFVTGAILAVDGGYSAS